MTYYDYKVVPAPRRARKVKGVSAAHDLFALTLTEAINEVARQGWEYCGSETLTSEAPSGWFRRGSVEDQSVLVFRRPREHLSPRLAAAPVEPAAAPADLLMGPGEGRRAVRFSRARCAASRGSATRARR